MRHLLIVILVFVPLLAAAWLFMKRGEPTTTIRVREAESAPAMLPGTTAMVGTEGRKLFAIATSTVTIGDEKVKYPSRYYWCDSFKKTTRNSLDSTDVIVVFNPVPKLPSDLERLLQLKTTDDAEVRFSAIQKSVRKLTSLRAKKGHFEGAEDLEHATSFRLNDADIYVARSGEDSERSKIYCTEVSADLSEGEISSLAAPGDFSYDRPDLSFRGAGLDLSATHLAVQRKIHLERSAVGVNGKAAVASMTLEADGPLDYRTTKSAVAGASVFDLLAFDGGDVVVENNVDLRAPGVSITARKMTAKMLPKNSATTRPSGSNLDFVRFEGNVVVKWRGLVLESPIVHVTFPKSEGFAIATEKNLCRLQFETSPGTATRPAEYVVATSVGGMTFDFAPPATGPESLSRLELIDDVKLIGGPESAPRLHLGGQKLRVDFQPIARGESAKNSTFELVAAEISGKVSGFVEGFDVATTKAVFERRFTKEGLLKREVVVLRGKSTVNSMAPAAATTEAKYEIAADEMIELQSATSPYEDSIANARGNAVIKRTLGKDVDRLAASEVTCVASPIVGDVADGKAPTRRRLRSVDGAKKVDIVDRFGRRMFGDSVHFEMEPLLCDLSGAPARVENVALAEGGERKGSLVAKHVVVDTEKGKVSADGKVALVLALPDFDVFANPADESTLGSNPFAESGPTKALEWTIHADRMDLVSSPGAKSDFRSGRIELNGAVSATNGKKTMTATYVEYELGRGHGRAVGAPVVVTSTTGETDELKDRVEAPEIILDPASSYLRGHCDVTLHVFALDQSFSVRPANAPAAPRYEKIHITSEKDVLVSRDNVFFSGKTTMERSLVPSGELSSLTSESGQIRLGASRPGKKGGRGSIAKIDGYDNVVLKMGELVGHGDLVTIDFTRDELILYGTKKSCDLSVGRQTTRYGNRITYDMKSKALRIDNASNGPRK